MNASLINSLYQYMRENNPELVIALQETGSLSQYLTEKVTGIEAMIANLKQQSIPLPEIETICLQQLTSDLKPSLYNYILALLEEEFEQTYNSLVSDGLLQTEAINMLIYSQSAFDDLVFEEANVENRFIKYAITGLIKDYLASNSVKENMSDGLQQSAKVQGQY